MATGSEIKRLRAGMKSEMGGTLGHQANGANMPTSVILREAEKLVIKPGMKLVYDNELNRMVWK